MVHECDNVPVRGDVTIRALAGCQYVIGGFRGCTNEAAVRVTVCTGRIGRAERCADVTTFAGYVGMSAVENESGAEMVKRLLRGCIDLKQQESNGGQ